MFDAAQGATEALYPAIPECVFVTARDVHGGPFEADVGDGLRRHAFQRGIVDMHPAHQEVYTRLPPTHLCGVGLDRRALDRRLDEVGLPPTVFDAFSGQFRVVPRASKLVLRIWDLAERGGPAASLAVDAAFLDLLATMTLANGELGLVAPPPDIDDRRLARVIDYVESHLDGALNTGDMAAIACVSAFHFGRVFRAAVGETPHRYVMGRRLERAKAMLLAKAELDLTSVALATGFASHSHMTEVFRARTGLPPGEWRRRARL